MSMIMLTTSTVILTIPLTALSSIALVSALIMYSRSSRVTLRMAIPLYSSFPELL